MIFGKWMEGVCVSYFHRNIFRSVWHNRQASGYVQTTKHIHSGYSIVSSSEQLLGQKLPASGLLKISMKFSGKREAAPLSFVQTADSYSYCCFWSRKEGRDTPAWDLLLFAGEEWMEEVSPESHSWCWIVDTARGGMAKMSRNMWEGEEGMTLHKQEWDIACFCYSSTIPQKHPRDEAAEFGSPVATWSD